MTTQVIKATKVTDSMSAKCKNDMWTETTTVCRLRTIRMAPVWKNGWHKTGL